MSQVREPLPPGPEGPEQAPTENSALISLPRGKADQENTVVGDKDVNQPSSNQSIQPEIQDQSIWGNRNDGDLIRTQPQRLPQPNTSAVERGEEESGKIQNGYAGLSNGSGIHNGIKHMPADNRKHSAPVSEKMHRKIQSTLSVNSSGSKKSKISSAFSQKPGTSPEGPIFPLSLLCENQFTLQPPDISVTYCSFMQYQKTIAVFTVSWLACSVNFSPSVTLFLDKHPVASAHRRPAAAAVGTRWEMTVTAHVIWTVA
uniref:MyoD family inhibitor domain containing n=1 Tax=Amazona collaria TaxID=241587 RepID=A0A8B9G3F4_9PSIT